MPTVGSVASGVRTAQGLVCITLIAGLVLAVGARAGSDIPPPKHAWRWHLTGIILGPDLHEALFAADSETRVVLQGAQIDGWTLTDVRPGSVSLTYADEELRLGTTEWLTDDVRAAESIRREQVAQKARAVEAALDSQQQDQEIAETALGEATERMMRLKSR